MKKTTQEKINEVFDQLKETALEIVDDLQIADNLGGNFSCFIDKDLYKHFQKLDKKHTELHEKLQEEEQKQLKLALK